MNYIQHLGPNKYLLPWIWNEDFEHWRRYDNNRTYAVYIIHSSKTNNYTWEVMYLNDYWRRERGVCSNLEEAKANADRFAALIGYILIKDNMSCLL